MFVTKMAADGRSLIFSTYLGGSEEDLGKGITLDARGNAYVTGYTSSADFLTRKPFQTTSGGSIDALVIKLSQPAIPPLMLLLGD
jgi:Beta-propeller repeat